MKSKKKIKEELEEIIDDYTEEEYTKDICGCGCCGDGYYPVIKEINNLKCDLCELIDKIKFKKKK